MSWPYYSLASCHRFPSCSTRAVFSVARQKQHPADSLDDIKSIQLYLSPLNLVYFFRWSSGTYTALIQPQPISGNLRLLSGQLLHRITLILAAGVNMLNAGLSIYWNILLKLKIFEKWHDKTIDPLAGTGTWRIPSAAKWTHFAPYSENNCHIIIV